MKCCKTNAPLLSWERKGKCWIEPKVELEYELKHGISKTRKYPKRCIICYQENFIQLAKKMFSAKKVDSLLNREFYVFSYRGKEIGIVNSGIGAPMLSLILERLIIRGVKFVLSIGIAGSLQCKNINIGDLILCTKAMRCEGTSYFYQRPSKFAYPDWRLLKVVEEVAKESGVSYKKGPSVSLDAPYRHTIKNAVNFRKQGIITSECEAAALFAISKFRKIKAAAIFVVSDISTENFEWVPGFHTKKLEDGMSKLFMLAVKSLSKV